MFWITKPVQGAFNSFFGSSSHSIGYSAGRISYAEKAHPVKNIRKQLAGASAYYMVSTICVPSPFFYLMQGGRPNIWRFLTLQLLQGHTSLPTSRVLLYLLNVGRGFNSSSLHSCILHTFIFGPFQWRKATPMPRSIGHQPTSKEQDLLAQKFWLFIQSIESKACFLDMPFRKQFRLRYILTMSSCNSMGSVCQGFKSLPCSSLWLLCTWD